MDAEKIYHELVEIKISQALMKDDLKEHMRRTEILEKTIIPLNNAWTIGKWVVGTIVATLGVLGTVAKIYEALNK